MICAPASLALLLAVAQPPLIPTDPQTAGVGVVPAAWGRSSLSAIASPASLVRLERGECSAYFSETGGGGWYAGCAAGKSWPSLAVGLHAGRLLERGSDDRRDLTFGGVTLARVITGSPFGFIEEFFGPSLAVGLGVRASTWLEDPPAGTGESERRTGLDLDCGLQFSVFPTFALGFSGLRVLELADSTGEASFSYCATYVFNRDLTGHLGWTSGGIGLGAGVELAVFDALRVRTGTDGEGWSWGATARLGDLFDMTYGLELEDDASAMHSLSLTCRFGERRSFR